MQESIFIGRQKELDRMSALYKNEKPNIVVVKGRRRVGKSRLIKEFSKKSKPETFWSFAGLAPDDGISAQSQRDHFARQIAFILKIPPLTFLDWADAFNYLSLHIKKGDIIFFDEISWMASKDPTFMPKLKAWYDDQNMHMMLIFCSSVSIWIEENILKSTAFFGRINLTLNLEPFTIFESSQFLRQLNMKISTYDMYKILCIVGGIPWYLEQFNPSITVDENIKQLAFEKNGLLVMEFDRIFHDLFNKKGATYKKILNILKDGPKTLSDIREEISFSHSGTLSEMMENLIVSGFIQKQQLWSFKTTHDLKQSLYMILDPYIRFYLKIIEPNLNAISNASFDDVPLSVMPGFETHLGLQLELLLIQNRSLLLKKLGISGVDVLRNGPYRQTKNANQDGCQIDYLVHTKTNILYICEFKFKKREISIDIINDMQNKIKRLKTPKGFAKVPVLFHLNGVSSKVVMENYFYRIIDISDFIDNF